MNNCPIKGNYTALPHQATKRLSKQEQDRIIELALNVLIDRHLPGTKLTSLHATRDYLKLLLQSECNDVFSCIYLTAQHEAINQNTLFPGKTVRSRYWIYEPWIRSSLEAQVLHRWRSWE